MNIQAKITHIDGKKIQNSIGILIIDCLDNRLNGLYSIKPKRYIAQGNRNRFHRNKFITVIARQES